MMQFINSLLGLITAIILLVTAIIGLINKLYHLYYKIPRRVKSKLGAKIYSLAVPIFFIVGLGMLLIRLTYKPSTVSILSPSVSIEATAKGDSVWFPVSGTSSGVFSDKMLMIYVLVYSDPEWHVQRPAMVEQDGRWTLTQAWIGDASAPINIGDQIKLIAVVSRGKYRQDDKFPDYRQLNPVAESAIVTAKVAAILGR